jgi:peptidyl-tRNA hydrolase
MTCFSSSQITRDPIIERPFTFLLLWRSMALQKPTNYYDSTSHHVKDCSNFLQRYKKSALVVVDLRYYFVVIDDVDELL